MSKSIKKNNEIVELIQNRIIAITSSRKTPWQGTMTDLLTKISSGRKIPERFPKSPSALRRVINTMESSIRRAGYETQFSRMADRSRTRLVSFIPVSKS